MTRRLFVLTALAASCNPYAYQKGEFNAGSVDPANFAAPYKGVGASTDVNGFVAGRGTFTEIRAYAGNQQVTGYYFFPFTDTQLRAQGDQALQIYTSSKFNPYAPNAYVFDPAPPSPFPPSQTCTPPRNYQYNEELDEMRLDEQSNIFTLLPIATERPGVASTFEYIPVVAEFAVSASRLNCQDIKSEATLNRILGTPPPTGKFLLWAIIDPSSPVLRVGQTADRTQINLPDGSPNPNFTRGQNVQKWGWFRQYYLAYIDGGYIPADTTLSPPTSNCGGSACSAGQVCGRASNVCHTCQETGEYVCPSNHFCSANGLCTRIKMGVQKLYVPNRVLMDGPPCGSTGAPCPLGQVCANNQCKTCTASGAQACPPGFQCGTSAPVLNLCNASGTTGSGGDVLEWRRNSDGYSPVCEVHVYNAGTVGTRPKSVSELPRNADAVRNLDGMVDNPDHLGSPRYIYCPQVD